MNDLEQHVNDLVEAHSLHRISPAQPILLARSSLDIGVDALVHAGVADLVRRPLVGAELASVLTRCLASAKAPAARDIGM